MMASIEEDAKLEYMLRQAALLEAQMKLSASEQSRSSQEESIQSKQSSIPSKRDSLSRSGTSSGSDARIGREVPVDDMLRQAELLCQKMRSSRHHAYAETVLTENPDDSVNDMLRKAELLSLQMKGTQQTPPAARGTTASVVESTPALIRQSERILSNMYHSEQPSKDVTTPELMRQTEHLLGKMKASRTQNADNENRTNSSGLLSNDALIAKMKDDERVDSHGESLPDQQMSGGHDTNKRSQELKHLMEKALSSWTGSPEEKCRVKNALEQIMPSLDSTPHTPSTVSIQQPDDMSSVGSQSPRTNRSTTKARSLLSTADRPPLPPQSQNVDAAVEMARNMAIALEETRSRSSSDAENFTEDIVVEAAELGSDKPIETQTRATPPRHSSLPKSPPRSARRNVRSPPPPLKEGAPPLESDERRTQSMQSSQRKEPPRSARRNIPVSPSPREAVPPSTDIEKRTPSQSRSSASFEPSREPVSSEEAQYNAIMSAIASSGRGPVSWEKVDSVCADDDDYVPLVDYCKRSPRRSLGSGTFAIPVMGRSPRGRCRRRRSVRMVGACFVLLAIGVAVKFWWLSGVINQDTMDEYEPLVVTNIEEMEDLHYHEPTVESLVKKASEPQSKDGWVLVEANAIALVPVSAKFRMREKVARLAQRARKLFVRFVVILTPPWERFCPGDAQACRDTNYLINSLGSS